MCSVTGTLCTKSKKNGALFVSHVPLTLSLHRMCFQHSSSDLRSSILKTYKIKFSFYYPEQALFIFYPPSTTITKWYVYIHTHTQRNLLSQSSGGFFNHLCSFFLQQHSTESSKIIGGCSLFGSGSLFGPSWRVPFTFDVIGGPRFVQGLLSGVTANFYYVVGQW